MTTQIINGKIFTPAGWIENGSVLIDGMKIKRVLTSPEVIEGVDKVIDAKGDYVLPGGIDLHVHGGGGRDFMEGTEEAFKVAVEAHRAHGTTAIYPTLSSSSVKMIEDAAEVCQKMMDDPTSGVLGLHLEGPYFNPKMAGAQIPEFITPPIEKDYKMLVETYPCIKRWDAAPELPGAEEFARYLTSKGVLASLGHTAAEYEDVEKGYEAGFTHATHFYNAMTGNHKVGVYKHAGTIESVYLKDGITVEMIADGIHVPPVIMRLVHKEKGVERVALITDSLDCAASDSKTAFDPRVIIEDGVCKLADRSAIAGSIATMDRLVKTAVQKAGLPLEDVARMTSETPARIMGVSDKKGSIENGKDADIMMYDKDLNLTGVVQMGREIPVATEA